VTVTVCVPVWNGASFVAETLESLRNQTLTDFRALISVDRSDDESVAICRAFESDTRFMVTVQPERLGWIGNVNALLARVETELGCILPHDDLLAPVYLERLVKRLDAEPSAVLAYSDIEMFGPRADTRIQPELVGTRLTRILAFLNDHFAAVGWRGVFRSLVLEKGHFHRDEPKADTLWLLELAGEGDLLRVPEVLYRKRLHKDSARNQPDWYMPSRAINWLDHCAACYEIAMSAAEWSVRERQEIAAAALARALRFHEPSFAPGAPEREAALITAASHYYLRVAGDIPRGTAPLDGEAPFYQPSRERANLRRQSAKRAKRARGKRQEIADAGSSPFSERQ
jgi:glycosyltransferase involved in cell wall biosynthesis